MKPGQYWMDSWNVTTGCTKVSAGCANCWAAGMAKRFPRVHTRPCPTYPEQCTVTAPFSEVVCHPDRLGKPLHWRKPRVVFVSLLGDLFHEDVPDDFILKVFLAIAEAPVLHTYLMLTKRPERMRRFLNLTEDWDPSEWPQVWLGVTVEDQATADERIPILLDTPAAHRWVSVEPMLGPVDLSDWLGPDPTFHHESGLHQIIAGCESGPKRRPAPHGWFRELRDQCATAGLPLFIKQMAEYVNGTGKVVKAPLLDGVRHDRLGWEV